MGKEKWDIYYTKKSPIVKFIEFVNEIYFSKIFELSFRSIVKSLNRKKILEAACGSGIMSSRIAKQGAAVTLLDISVNALNIAKYNFNKAGVSAEFIRGDILNMPFKNETYDIVWNQGVLEHFDNPEKVLKEMGRVTKKGGFIIAYVPAFFSPLHFIYLFLNLIKHKELWPFDEQIFFKKSQLKSAFEKAGFKNIKIYRLPLSIGFSMVGYCRK